jgi:hypothetical protein
MPSFMTQPARRLALAACFFTTSLSLAQGTPPAFANLAALQTSPETAGALVYRGNTFTQRTPAGPPLFTYERRVMTKPTGLSASHITSDAAGRIIIVESAVTSNNYETLRFEVTNQQAGFSGTVQISNNGRHLEYELNDNGKHSTASEDVTDPVVTGPSLFGFIIKNWDPLLSGASVPVRMLVLRQKTTYGFDLKVEQVDQLGKGQVAFTITPSHFLIRMAIAPMRVVFDASTRTPIQYKGRVPPMENVSGKLKDLDAQVDYVSISAAYR